MGRAVPSDGGADGDSWAGRGDGGAWFSACAVPADSAASASAATTPAPAAPRRRGRAADGRAAAGVRTVRVDFTVGCSTFFDGAAPDGAPHP
ncbi:hypothetical protein [Streptomyces sp. RPA4-5]|uniref:hypothetical protein n=1 Tax=Streptomyces sp. RPA4-5 TaxID=2721245 RepID=UPI002001E1EC|nr:hypothetical protein [Streptomyces sp. RPA4-5]